MSELQRVVITRRPGEAIVILYAGEPIARVAVEAIPDTRAVLATEPKHPLVEVVREERQ